MIVIHTCSFNKLRVYIYIYIYIYNRNFRNWRAPPSFGMCVVYLVYVSPLAQLNSLRRWRDGEKGITLWKNLSECWLLKLWKSAVTWPMGQNPSPIIYIIPYHTPYPEFRSVSSPMAGGHFGCRYGVVCWVRWALVSTLHRDTLNGSWDRNSWKMYFLRFLAFVAAV